MVQKRTPQTDDVAKVYGADRITHKRNGDKAIKKDFFALDRELRTFYRQWFVDNGYAVNINGDQLRWADEVPAGKGE
jgi:hypothetical protein